MKKILYIIGVVFALISCNKQMVDPIDGGGGGAFTFDVALEDPDGAGVSRADAGVSRYILEMYAGGDTSTEPARQENDSGVFKVDLQAGVEYLCLFWADGGAECYNAESLLALTEDTNTESGSVGYCSRKTVSRDAFDGAVTLRHAVSEMVYTETTGFATTDNKLEVVYPRFGLNVADGKVSHLGDVVNTHTFTAIGAVEAGGTVATDYVLAPIDKIVVDGIKITFNSDESKEVPGTTLQANYRVKVSGEFTSSVPPVPELDPLMKFTIDTRKNQNDATDKTFIIPLTATLSGYALTVDWGDGAIEEFADGTVLDQANMTHTYLAAGEYTITITSSQKDFNKIQMPKFNFRDNYNEKSNPQKLISLDTPLLNMGNDLSDCFYECFELTSIAVGLFDKNTAATNFARCFLGCTKAVLNANIFCDEATEMKTRFAGKSMQFISCFQNCGSDPSIGAAAGGTAPALWDYTMTVLNKSDCFDNVTKVTNVNTIPSTWK